MDLESNEPTVVSEKVEDKDDEGNGNKAANPNQTSRVSYEGPSKLNTLEKTTDQQGKGGEGSPYKGIRPKQRPSKKEDLNRFLGEIKKCSRISSIMEVLVSVVPGVDAAH
ncbi:uncharacterized protein E6C27_scaffold154G00920 [Cucumis melo var. makuwa]|uniref:Uncharacterized protein n=1 Tax=Cucumis melo var. makuwa TaxID=1194695 RepID=A0A5A7V8W3_CUCMM|nr:uncharacterized protein E6C27_scaffold154G00920 [Cucumis melo var. makuwa]